MTIFQSGGVAFDSGARIYLDSDKSVLYAYIDHPNAEMICYLLVEAMNKSEEDAFKFFSFDEHSSF